MVPANGTGSFHSMSMEPVLTAAATNPLLTTFAADAKVAGLGPDLAGMHSFTVFAPANDAFAKVGASAMSMMHSTAELAKTLIYLIVGQQVTPARLATGAPLTTLEGGTLSPSKMGSVYEVNAADVICGDIQTENATLYIVNQVLMPMH